MKKILKVVILIIAIVGVVKVLNVINEKEYQKAISRCGSKDNLVISYTQQGDKYYSCKVEK